MILGLNNLHTNAINAMSRINLASKPSFCGVKTLDKDKIETSDNVSKVKIKDMNGNDVNALIVAEESKNPEITNNCKKFSLYVKGEQIGYIVVQDSMDKDILKVPYLYSQEHEARTYKGIGTELLKCAVNESIKRGYNGKIMLQASHGAYSPMAFYYKNNFVIPKSKMYTHRDNAAVQYAIENNVPVKDVISSNHSDAFMKLDEEGGKAFLDGKRLYNNRTYEKIAQKNIEGENYSANLIKSPNKDEYFLLVANDDAKDFKATLTVTLQELKDENNKKHFKICDIYDYELGEEKDINFAFESLENFAKLKGYDETTIETETDLKRSSKRLYKNSEYKFKEE